jgi:hypothetical protein
MPTITKPKQGEDVRVLHRNVEELIEGINALTNMTAVWHGRAKGVGKLSVRGADSELYIKVKDINKGGGGGLILPSISLTSSKNPVTEHKEVVFTCNILNARDGSTVQFSVDGVSIGVFTVANQIAVTDAVTFEPGDYSIRADFSGDSAHLPGSVSIVQVVLERPTPNMNFASSKNPSDDGDDIYFGVNMSDNILDPPIPLPTGVISFFHNGNPYDAAALDINQVAFSVHNTQFSPGHHSMEARYGGDSNWSEVTETLDQIVKASAELVMYMIPGPTIPTGVAFIIYIEVNAVSGLPTPTGQVDIHQNGNTSGWFNLDGGRAEFSVEAGMPIGTYTWFFDYSGDGHYSSDFSPIYIQYVIERVPHDLTWQSVGNTPYFGYRLYTGWPPGTEAIYQLQVHDNSGSNFNGTIGINFYAIGGHGYIVVKLGGTEIYRGTPNLYFNGVPMYGNSIYFEMVNGYSQPIWISWNVPNYPIWDYNGPILESSDGSGNPAYVFLRFFDPYDGSTVGPDLGNFLNP